MRIEIFASAKTASICLAVLLASSAASLASAAILQDLTLAPAPVQEIPVQKVPGVDLTPKGSCISVEGPRLVSSDGGVTFKPAPDDFTTCSLALFQGQLAIPTGTQNTEDMLTSLESCFQNPEMSRKTALIIGHGSPGLISTGNGKLPGINQTFSAGDGEAIKRLTKLSSSGFLLFGCETGAEAAGQAIVNALSENAATRAPNGLVFCSLDPERNGERRGLYILKADDPQLVEAKPGKPADLRRAALTTLSPQACFAIKKKDGSFKISTPQQFEDLMSSNKISVLKYSAKDSAVAGMDSTAFNLMITEPDMQFNALVRRTSRRLIEKIDFCKTLPTDLNLALDARITGTISLDIEGETRIFNVLSDRLVQDIANPGVYYPIQPGGLASFDNEITSSWQEITQSKRNRKQRQSRK